MGSGRGRCGWGGVDGGGGAEGVRSLKGGEGCVKGLWRG